MEVQLAVTALQQWAFQWFVPVVFTARCYRATQSAVMRQCVVCLSVCLSVRDVQVPWSHRLEYVEKNFTAK